MDIKFLDGHVRGEMEKMRTWRVYVGTEEEKDRHIYKVQADDVDQVKNIAEKQATNAGYIITHKSRIMDIVTEAALGC